MWAEMALTLAESVILPMDIIEYATYLKKSFNDIENRYGKQLSDNNATLGGDNNCLNKAKYCFYDFVYFFLVYFERAINQFSDAMVNFSDVTLKEFDNNK